MTDSYVTLSVRIAGHRAFSRIGLFGMTRSHVSNADLIMILGTVCISRCGKNEDSVEYAQTRTMAQSLRHLHYFSVVDTG